MFYRVLSSRSKGIIRSLVVVVWALLGGLQEQCVI